MDVPALSMSCWLMLKTTNFLAALTVSVLGWLSSSEGESESTASSGSTWVDDELVSGFCLRFLYLGVLSSGWQYPPSASESSDLISSFIISVPSGS